MTVCRRVLTVGIYDPAIQTKLELPNKVRTSISRRRLEQKKSREMATLSS